MKIKFVYINLFFIIFAFRIPVFYNSTILSLCLLISEFLIFSLSNKRIIDISIFRRKDFVLLIVMYLVLILFCYLFPIIHQTYDFSKPGALYSQIFSIIVIYLLSLYTKRTIKGDKVRFALKAIFIVFLLQSLFVLGCFISPHFNQIIESFRSPDGTQYSEFGRYEGIKRLSLSGGQYFTLSTCWVFGLICSTIFLKEKKYNFMVIFFIILFLTFSAVTAGRTSLLGLLFSMLFLIKKPSYRSFILSLILIPLISVILFNIYSFLLHTHKDFLKFALEFYYNWKENGHLSTESTNVLASMYVPIDINTIIFGDGKYMYSNGEYYMHTDVGYLRNLFFYGFLGLSINILSDFVKLYLINKFSNGRLKLFSIFSFLSLLIIHGKGEIFNHVVSVQVIIYWLLFCCYFNYKENAKNEKDNVLL